jgi:hypothetical protein
MSEELTERLSRFTPDRGGLDRDALLIGAGRASARPNRRWVALAGMLAASQVLTLVLLWPRPAVPGVTPVVQSPQKPAVPAPPQDPAPQPRTTLSALRTTLSEALSGPQADLPPLRPVPDLCPDAPPLRACLALSGEIAY